MYIIVAVDIVVVVATVVVARKQTKQIYARLMTRQELEDYGVGEEEEVDFVRIAVSRYNELTTKPVLSSFSACSRDSNGLSRSLNKA